MNKQKQQLHTTILYVILFLVSTFFINQFECQQKNEISTLSTVTSIDIVESNYFINSFDEDYDGDLGDSDSSDSSDSNGHISSNSKSSSGHSSSHDGSNSNSNNDGSNSNSQNNNNGGSGEPIPIPVDGLLNATATVYFSGGISLCKNISSCDQGYLFDENYACSYANRGDWDDGTKYFQDPIPSGIAASSVVGISFTIYGTIGCSESDQIQTIIQISIQNEIVITNTSQRSDLCECGSCYLQSKIDPIKYHMVGYNSTGLNKFLIVISQNAICANSIEIIFYYNGGVTSPPVTPTLSPTSTPTYSPTPTPTPTHSSTPSPYSGFLSPQDKKYIIIASSVTGGLLFAIATFVLIRNKLKKKRSGYTMIKDGKDIDIHQIKIGVRIGKGNFGEVFLGSWRGSQVAVKKLPAHNINENVLKEFHREINLMKNLRHPNVIQFLGSCSIPPDICICTEYMPRGSLYSILHNEKLTISWTLLKRMLIDTAKGIIYLHGSNPVILHRDLKSHNLLVDENWKVKVADFGLSTIEQQGATMTACGTPCWTSPEVLRSQRYTEKADVYSFGIILWECATRQDPYFGIPPFQVIFAVGREGLRPPTPPNSPIKYTQLISDCLSENPSHRPTMEQCLERLELIDTNGYMDILTTPQYTNNNNNNNNNNTIN